MPVLTKDQKTLRSNKKKLRHYEQKNPGVKGDHWKTLKKDVITIEVQIAREGQIKVEKEIQKQVKDEKRQELLVIQNMTEDEYLDIQHKENAPENARIRKNEKNRARKKKKKEAKKKAQEEEEEKFYKEVHQPQIAKAIINYIVQH
tara:strand:- start:65 stop:502 length:438 start_codon:yes stop_codon:yes gene_type:complete